MLGSTKPRLFTPPLVTGEPGPCGCGCALTPATSYGFRVVRFAEEILEMPLDPWERWLVIHAGELLPDGTPRFRKVLVIVARQNGKTHVLVVLSLYWLFVERHKLILGTSTNLDYAQESWEKAVEIAESIEELDERIPARGGIRRTNGQNTLRTTYRSRYKIAASNRKGGRSLTVHRLILDVAPFFLSISPLDVEFIELVYGFDLRAERNRNEVVFDALLAESPLARLIDHGHEAVLESQPFLGFSLNEKCDLQAFVEVKTRGKSTEVTTGRFDDEPISVYLTVRQYGGLKSVSDFMTVFGSLAGHVERLAEDRVVPHIVLPIRETILANPG